MKRFALLAFVLCLALPAFARQRISVWCEAGNGTVTIGGLSATTKFMQSYPSATVSIFDTGTTNLSTIYADNSGTAKANPFTCASDGFAFFYANNGRYDIKLSGTGITTPFTKADYLLFDPVQFTYIVNAMAFNATPTFDAGAASIFTMTLTGNVTSSTINNSVTGQTIFFTLCQDGTGNRTFSWPVLFIRPPTIAASASACTNAEFFYDGTNWRQAGATGDSLTASTIYNAGSPLTLPSGPETLMGRASADTESNKTLNSPTINTPIITSPTTTGTDAGAETLKNKTLNGASSGNAVTLLNVQGSLSDITGTVAETTVYTYTLPANTLGAGKGLRVKFAYLHSTGSGTNTYKFYFGGSNVVQSYSNASVAQDVHTYTVFNNAGVQNAQTILAENTDNAVTGSAIFTAAIDTTASQTIKFTVTPGVSGDHLTPKFWLIEIIQ